METKPNGREVVNDLAEATLVAVLVCRCCGGSGCVAVAGDAVKRRNRERSLRRDQLRGRR